MNCKKRKIDTEGREKVPCSYDYIFDFLEGLAEVEKNGKKGVIVNDWLI